MLSILLIKFQLWISSFVYKEEMSSMITHIISSAVTFIYDVLNYLEIIS